MKPKAHMSSRSPVPTHQVSPRFIIGPKAATREARRVSSCEITIGGIYVHPEVSFVFVVTNVTHAHGGKVRGLWYTRKGQKVSSIHDSLDLESFKKTMRLISRD